MQTTCGIHCHPDTETCTGRCERSSDGAPQAPIFDLDKPEGQRELLQAARLWEVGLRRNNKPSEAARLCGVLAALIDYTQLLQAEVDVLRRFGNKDCTSMADAHLAEQKAAA